VSGRGNRLLEAISWKNVHFAMKTVKFKKLNFPILIQNQNLRFPYF